MAETTQKKRGRPKKVAPSPPSKSIQRRNGVVTLGKNATLGKRAS